MVELAILDKARKQLSERKARMAILDKAQNQRRDPKAGFAIWDRVTAEGGTQDEAAENACRQAFAQFLLADLAHVVLRPKHWTIPPQALLGGLPQRFSLSMQHQALPVHVRTRVGEAGAENASLSEVSLQQQQQQPQHQHQQAV